jgi:hypothetical protein
MRGVASSVVRRALLVLTATRVNLVPSDDQTTWNASNHRSKVILGGSNRLSRQLFTPSHRVSWGQMQYCTVQSDFGTVQT